MDRNELGRNELSRNNLEEKQNLENGILGSYENATVIWQGDNEGNYHRTFDDTFITVEDNSHKVERVMDIDGKIFNICSVFPIAKSTSPIKKLLNMIDNE